MLETADAIIVRVEIPGVRGEGLRVDVDGSCLRIRGIRRVPARVPVQRLLQMEIAFGPFEREVRIAAPFDHERVSARLEDGFLDVTLPKLRPSRRDVEVETE